MDKKKKLIIIISVASVLAVVLLITLLCVFLIPDKKEYLTNGKYYLIISGDMSEKVVLEIVDDKYTITVDEEFDFPYSGSGTYYFDGKQDFTLYKNDKSYVKGMLSNNLLVLVTDSGAVYNFKFSSIKPSEIPTNDVTVMLNYALEGGLYTVTGLATGCDDKSIVIPSERNGVKVVKIANGAFKDNANITSIKIPAGITTIGDEAFKNCVNLEKVNLPDSVSTIGYDAFSGTNILYDTLNGVNYIDNWAISVSDKLATKISLRNGTLGIYTDFLNGLNALKELELPAGLININEKALYGAKNLAVVTMPLNDKYVVENNALYSLKDGKKNKLVLVAAKSIDNEFEIDDEISECAFGCLYGAVSLQSLTLPFIGKSSGATGTYGVLGYLFGDTDYSSSAGDTEFVTQNYSASNYGTFYIPKSLKRITLSKSCTIAFGAFSNIAVEEVDLGKVAGISDFALSGIRNLVKLSIPNVDFQFGNLFGKTEYSGGVLTEQFNGTKTNAYYLPSTLKEVVVNLKGNDEIVTNYLFNGCKTLTDITFNGDGVELALKYGEIKDGDVVIDRRIQGFQGSFNGCDNLVNLNLGSNYTVENGVVYDKNKESLICVLVKNTLSGSEGNKTLTLPDGVKEICKYAFDFSGVKNLVLNDDALYFGEGIFDGLDTLNTSGNVNLNLLASGIVVSKDNKLILFVPSDVFGEVVLPKELTTVSESMFEKCTGITAYSFDGDNVTYYAFDGLIYNKAKTTVLLTPDAEKDTQKLLNTLTTINFEKLNAKSYSVTDVNGIETAGEYFSSNDGLVYNAEQTNLLFVPKAKTGVINLADTLIEISDYAFYESQAGEIVIGKNVKTIGQYAFGKTSATITFDNESTIEMIEKNSFNDYLGGEISLPSSVTTIGKGAFSGAKNLTKIKIPFVGGSASATGRSALLGYIFGDTEYDGGTKIEQAYSTTNSLDLNQKVTYYIPSSLKEVEIYGTNISLIYGAMSNITSLEKVVFDDGLIAFTTVLARSVFTGTTSLKEVVVSLTNENFTSSDGLLYNKAKTELIYCPTAFEGVLSLPETVAAFKQSVIDDVSSLSGIQIVENEYFTSSGGVLISKADGAVVGKPVNAGFEYTLLGNVYYAGGWAVGIAADSEITSITLKSGTVGIAASAFENSAFQTIDLNGVKFIGTNAFAYAKLTAVDLTGVETICVNAFLDNIELTSITFSDSVKKIGDNAFKILSENSVATGDIALPSSITTMGKQVFSGRNCTISVQFAETEKPVGWADDWAGSGITVNYA